MLYVHPNSNQISVDFGIQNRSKIASEAQQNRHQNFDCFLFEKIMILAPKILPESAQNGTQGME